MIGIIAALSPEGVIGVNGGLPWHYSADLKRFKQVTQGSTVIMGRHTWESLPKKPLPHRTNVVLSRKPMPDLPPGVEHYASLEDALEHHRGDDVWIIGGARVFRDGLQYADIIDITRIPDTIEADDAVYFPHIESTVWQAESPQELPEDPRLHIQRYTRRKFA